MPLPHASIIMNTLCSTLRHMLIATPTVSSFIFRLHRCSTLPLPHPTMSTTFHFSTFKFPFPDLQLGRNHLSYPQNPPPTQAPAALPCKKLLRRCRMIDHTAYQPQHSHVPQSCPATTSCKTRLRPSPITTSRRCPLFLVASFCS